MISFSASKISSFDDVDDKSEAKTSQNSKREFAANKRHSELRKTISFKPAINEIVIERNNNKQVHFSNDLFRTLCIFCDKDDKHMLSHYMKEHGDREMPIARPSPIMAYRLRNQFEPFIKKGNSITGFCYFCEERRTTKKNGWEVHLLRHTGEQLFHCKKCGVMVKAKSHHKNCDSKPVNIFDENASDGSLMAFVCKDCNYTQIQREQMIKHQKLEHGNTGESIYYEKLTLVPNFELPKNEIAYKYLDNATCLKCTICHEQTSDLNEFISHFDAKHFQVEEYVCVCGELLTLDDCGISGQFISVHLLEHSADLYSCIPCRDDSNDQILRRFFNEIEIHNHLLNEHPQYNELSFLRVHREVNNKITIVENVLKPVKCNVCKMHFQGNFADVEDHFRIQHQCQAVNCEALVTCKTIDSQDSHSQTISSIGRLFTIKLSTNN